MKCMILAAGYGKRMMPLTKETPKPLLKIGNETLLDRNIKHVLSNGFEELRQLWVPIAARSRVFGRTRAVRAGG